MSSARPSTNELDALIEEVTVDTYNDSEQLTAFETAFDEVARFPCHGTVIGEDVEVLSLTVDDDRGELVATCRRAGCPYKVHCKRSTCAPTPTRFGCSPPTNVSPGWAAGH